MVPTYGNIGDGAAAGILLAFGFVWFLFAVAAYVVTSIFLMKIFEKAGVQGKWRAWVPVYNFMVFSKLGDLSPWLILIAIGASIIIGIIPILGALLGWLLWLATFALTLLAAWRVGLKLQKEPVWLILYVFLSIVWYGINAFDKSRWNTAIPAAPWAGNSFLSDQTTWEGVPSQVPAGGYPAAPVAQPGAYPPPAGYQPPPAGYQPPAPGYTQPPAPGAYPPPAGATPPPAAAYPPPAAPEPPAAPPAAPEPPTAPESPKP